MLGEKSWYIPRCSTLPNLTVEAPHDVEASRTIEVERPAERPAQAAAGRTRDEEAGVGLTADACLQASPY